MLNRLLAPVFFLSLLLPVACSAQEPVADNLQAGKDFQAIKNQQKPSDSSKIEVAEVFWYGCPHCFSLEPAVKKWKETMAADVKFVRMPAVFKGNKVWNYHARVYYTAEVLGVGDKIHEPMFQAIHNRKQSLGNDREVKAFLKPFGVTAEEFDSTSKSFAVETRLSQAEQRIKAYRMTSVPAIVVNGKYWTSSRFAGSNTAIFDVVDKLVARERAIR